MVDGTSGSSERPRRVWPRAGAVVGIVAAIGVLLVACGDTTAVSTGAPCDGPSDCGADAYCSSAGECATRKGSGETCADTLECVDGLGCLGGVCADAPGCSTRTECTAPFACIGGVCGAGAELGEACTNDDDCAQPLACGADGTCASAGPDADADGFDSIADGGTDCNDDDPSVNPDATDVCGDGIDQNCDGDDQPCEGADADLDGYIAEADGGDDCDDDDATIHPDAEDICGDGIDQDCSGDDRACPIVDEDGDGHAPLSEGGDDCDDDNPNVHGGAFDFCDDGIDQDCDGSDNVCVDSDGDGYPDEDQGGNDCADDNPEISPGAEERCGDGIDQDCDGMDNQCPTAACEFEPTPGNFTPQLEWEFFGTARGQNTGEHVNCTSTPIVVPLSDDNENGVPDIDDIPVVVFHAWVTNQRTNSILRALRGDDGTEIWNTEATGVETDGSSSPAAGDLDADGWPEIVVRHENGHVVAFDDDGTFLWEQTGVSADGASAAAISDLDHDGTPEVVYGKHVISNTGALLASGNKSFTGRNHRGAIPCVYDLDQSGNAEIITGPVAYSYDVDGSGNASLTEFWPSDANREAIGDGYCAIADVDVDGDPDVVHISLGTLAVFDGPTGEVLISFDVANATTSDDDNDGSQGRCGAPTIGDFDNDGAPEIGMACKWAYAVFDAELDGNGDLQLPLLWERETEDDSSHRTGSSVFDFEADGRAEVVYNDEEFLRVYDGETGMPKFETPNSSRTQAENPVIVDVNNDGNTEIVVCASNDDRFPHDPSLPNNHGITVWGDANDNWVPTRRIWNQHTYHVTNVADDGTIPANPTPNHTTFNNYRANAQGDGVFDAPDLVAEIVDVRAQTCPASLTFGVRIRNDGQLRVGPGISVHVLVTNQDGTVILDTVIMTTKGLPPGASQRLEVEVMGPIDAASLSIHVSADDDGTGAGTENECREDNNDDEELDVPCLIN